ncbi:MAG: hypothetical protein PWP44_1462 [Thermacetogenium sp.]|jgi:hypothetical protein|nr:hypothetical protein [Eubacteriales bacterium]MDN5366256.1 hypothetical protein [Thermacetogenium sp.]MDN5375022.1 hypothetical protein [Thermacetogenium sp.]
MRASKIWGMFAPKDLSYDFDRDPAKQPGLAEMTSKAMEVLSKDKDGFFLMVEESKIDWAAHANDPVGVISDILAFDNAVKAALDFAKKDKQTVLLLIARLLRPWSRRATVFTYPQALPRAGLWRGEGCKSLFMVKADRKWPHT